MGISIVDPSLSIERLVEQAESQFFDRKSGRLAARDFSHHPSATNRDS